MKKRRIWIGAGVAIFAVACLCFAARPHDEFDFLRKYPHTETVSPTDVGWARLSPYWSSAYRFRTFTFPEVSPELFGDIKRFSSTHPSLGRMEIVFPSGRKGTFRHTSVDSRLMLSDEPPPTWIAQAWASVRERLGMVSRQEQAELER